ncbi:MAG: UbiX family flavin prenyltransferase [Elusimicrobiota bacterium]
MRITDDRIPPPFSGRYVVAITGASGGVIGIRLVEELLKRGCEVHAIVTSAAREVLRHELGRSFRVPSQAVLHEERDALSRLNSSSFMADAMVVAPCSLKTLAGIACGYADNLVVRTADTVLRTGRRLVLVPRETPLSLSALENMVRLRKDGALIMPPCAAYYHRPKSVDAMTDFFVGKILDLLGMDNSLYARWGQEGE